MSTTTSVRVSHQADAPRAIFPTRHVGHARRATGFALGLAVFACAACPLGEPPVEDDPRAVSFIEPVNPTGAVSGLITDALTGVAIDGALVALMNDATEGRRSVTTGADGTFRIDEVESSASVALVISKSGFTTATATVNIPSSAGNLAQDNGLAFAGPIGLFAVGGDDALKPRYRVVDPSGEPVADASLSTSLNIAFVNDGVEAGALMGVARVDGTAIVVDGFPDLASLASVFPHALIRAVAVPPTGSTFRAVLVEKSVADVLASGDVSVVLGAEPTPPILDAGPVPVDEETPLEIVDGTVADLIDAAALGIPAGARPVLPSTLSANAPITLVLSRPIDATSAFIGAVDEFGTAFALGAITVSPSSVVGESTVSVGAPTAGWPLGSEVNVTVDFLPSGPGATGIAPIFRRGTALVSTGAALTFDGARLVDAAGANACPEQATSILVGVSSPVGHRAANGAAALGAGAILAVRATSTDPRVPTTNPLHPEGTGTVFANVVEPTNGFTNSGYTTTVEVPWTYPFASFEITQGTISFPFTLSLRFNDVENAQGSGVVRESLGSPVGVVSGSTTLAVTTADGNACNP